MKIPITQLITGQSFSLSYLTLEQTYLYRIQDVKPNGDLPLFPFYLQTLKAFLLVLNRLFAFFLTKKADKFCGDLPAFPLLKTFIIYYLVGVVAP